MAQSEDAIFAVTFYPDFAYSSHTLCFPSKLKVSPPPLRFYKTEHPNKTDPIQPTLPHPLTSIIKYAQTPTLLKSIMYLLLFTRLSAYLVLVYGGLFLFTHDGVFFVLHAAFEYEYMYK